MNNQLDDPIAHHLPAMSIDPVEEALSSLSHLSKERRKIVALQLMNQLHLADKTETAQEAGIYSVNQKTRDLIMRVIVFAFIFIVVGSFLALVLFDVLGIKADTNLLFTLITITGGFLGGVLVPAPGSSQTRK